MTRRPVALAAASLLAAAALTTARAARIAPAPQGGCNAAAAHRLADSAWNAYRADAFARAESLFTASRAACREIPRAWTGLGFVQLRLGRPPERALAQFDSAVARAPRAADAWQGRGLALWRLARPADARAAFARALAIDSTDAVSRDYVARIAAPVDASALTPYVRPDTTVVAARTGRRRFEVPDGRGGWRPVFIKAVNIGAALPGKHPSEFPPDDSTYEHWIADVAALGANTVRVYTIHPPHFYRALAAWNRAHPARPLWLIHGVWTELPPGRQEERYDDPAWRGEFVAEARRVVDLIHGNAAIQHRPGHASGLFDVDVSPWTIGYIIGREWEPHSVVGYARLNPRRRAYTGTYLSVAGGNAVDAWLAQFSDEMIAYEMGRYNAQRPMAYTNWPTLDPLPHPTETTRAEEAAILARRRERPPEASREYDNDAIGLDATRARATAAFTAGTFASYHAYPYYPDFMIHDPGYLTTRSPWGPSAYFGYLRALVEHHGDMPVIISEFGVPSSRGNAHLQPQGWHHGGHDERQQGEVNARLSREIHASGAAGLGLFAMIDEWFKKNWLVIDFELPGDRNRLWLNTLDAEQNYGLIAMRPGVRDSAIVIDGDPLDWRGRPAAARRGNSTASTGTASTGTAPAATASEPLHPAARLDSLTIAWDEGWLYLRLDVGAVDWSRAAYLIGIDTHEPARGERAMPRTGTRTNTGLEFAIDLRGPDDARVLASRPYNPFRLAPIVGATPPVAMMIYNRPFRSLTVSGGWDSLVVTPNRRRFGRDGTVFPAQRQERGALRHARQQETSLADWFASPTGIVEVRIPWGLLNVTDPSSRSVLWGLAPNGRDPASASTSGFRFVVESYDPAAPRGGLDRLPGGAGAGFSSAIAWTWPTWEAPRWYAERKPAFAIVRDAWATIPDGGQ